MRRSGDERLRRSTSPMRGEVILPLPPGRPLPLLCRLPHRRVLRADAAAPPRRTRPRTSLGDPPRLRSRNPGGIRPCRLSPVGPMGAKAVVHSSARRNGASPSGRAPNRGRAHGPRQRGAPHRGESDGRRVSLSTVRRSRGMCAVGFSPGTPLANTPGNGAPGNARVPPADGLQRVHSARPPRHGGGGTASPRTSSQPWNTRARPVNRTVGYCRPSVSSER